MPPLAWNEEKREIKKIGFLSNLDFYCENYDSQNRAYKETLDKLGKKYEIV